MTTTNKRTYILTSLVCLLPVIAGAILYSSLPDQVAIHWDYNGVPNGWASKFVGAIVLPGILFVINLLFPVLIKMDPKNKNLSPKILAVIQWIIPVVCMVCSVTTLAAAKGINVKIQLVAPLLVGLMFIITGNYMPKMTQSYTVGIKLPWTLNDEENWNKTHRISGFIWVIGGIATILNAFLFSSKILYIAVLVLMILVPVIYSYSLYAKSNK